MSDYVELSTQSSSTALARMSPELPTLEQVLHGEVWDITTPPSYEVPKTPEGRDLPLWSPRTRLAEPYHNSQDFVGEIGFSYSPSLRRPRDPESSNFASNPLHGGPSLSQKLPLNNEDLPQLFGES